jgi:hypothetical protein
MHLQDLKLRKFSRLAQPIRYCQKENRSNTAGKGFRLLKERGRETGPAPEIKVRGSISLIRETIVYKEKEHQGHRRDTLCQISSICAVQETSMQFLTV